MCVLADAASLPQNNDPTPSPEDIRLTQEAGRVGDMLGIDLLDHIVIGKQGHVMRAPVLFESSILITSEILTCQIPN